MFPFRGVIFDIDPVFNNTEEWWQSIPAERAAAARTSRSTTCSPRTRETEYIAYVSEQNLLPDTSGEPVRHPQVAEVFERDDSGGYRPRNVDAELTGFSAPKQKRRRLEPRLLLLSRRADSGYAAARRRGRPRLLALQLLARLFGPLLQLVLQLLLLLLEHLRIGRRPVIGLGEILQWQLQAHRLAVHVDRLHGEGLALLHRA